MRKRIPELLQVLMTPHLLKLDEVISPGLVSLRWNSLDLETYAAAVRSSIQKTELLINRAINILEVRVEGEFNNLSSVVMCELPDSELWTTEEFLMKTSVSTNIFTVTYRGSIIKHNILLIVYINGSCVLRISKMIIILLMVHLYY